MWSLFYLRYIYAKILWKKVNPKNVKAFKEDGKPFSLFEMNFF